MAEDLEKYRGLYNIVKNPKNTKQQEKLFDSAGLFGVLQSKYPKAFELFADWVREVKFEKHEINDNLIKVEKFTEFLAKQKGNEDLIKYINELHQENIIKDKIPTDNTLLEFAKVLINLKIIEKHENSLANYRLVRNKYVDLMKPLVDKKVDAKTTPEKIGQAKPGIGGKISPADAKAPESKEVTSTSAGGGGGYDSSEATNLTASSSTSSSTENTTGIQPSTEKLTEEKPVTPTVPVAPVIPVTPGASAIPVTPVSQKPVDVTPIAPIITPEKNKINEKDQELKTSGLEEARKMEEKRAGEAQLEQPQASATPSIALPRFGKTRGKGRRVVARRGAHGDKVRVSAKEGPQRVQPDKARNRLTQNAQANAQNEQDNYDNQLTQNARNQQAAEEGEDEGSTKKGSLAKSLLKKGAFVSIAAGGGLFASLTNTEAATFAVSHASTTFKSIISLIHLFIK